MTQPQASPAYENATGLPPAPPVGAEPPHRPYVAGTNGLAITALVLGLVGFIPLANICAFIFGIMALVQLKTRTQVGKGVAIGGMAAAGVWLLVFAGLIAAALTGSSARDDVGAVVRSGRISINDLRAGDCVNGVREDAPVANLTAVHCAQAHDGEVFAVFDLADGPFPGESVVTQLSEAGCLDRLTTYAPNTADEVDVLYYQPTQGTWRRHRGVVCLAYHTPPAIGSIRA